MKDNPDVSRLKEMQRRKGEQEQFSQTALPSRGWQILLGLLLSLAPILIAGLCLLILIFWHIPLFQATQVLLWVSGASLGIAFVLILISLSSRSRTTIAVSALPIFILSSVAFITLMVIAYLYSSIYTQLTQPLYAQYHGFQMQTGQTATDDGTHLSLTVLSIRKIPSSDTTYVIIHITIKNDSSEEVLLDTFAFDIARNYNYEDVTPFNKDIPGYRGRAIFRVDQAVLTIAAGKTVDGDLTFSFPDYYNQPQTFKWTPEQYNQYTWQLDAH